MNRPQLIYYVISCLYLQLESILSNQTQLSYFSQKYREELGLFTYIFIAMNLASIIKVVTNFYFLLIQEISPLHRIKTFLRTDFLSDLSIAKSELEQLVRILGLSTKKTILILGLNLQYLKTFFKALICFLDRLLENELNLLIVKVMLGLVIIVGYI